MSLSSAINTAQSMLSNTARQSSVVSRNISNSGNADYSQRSAVLSTAGNGSQVVRIDRAKNVALLRQVLSGNGQSSGQSALLAGLNQLDAAMGGSDYATAPSTLLANFRDALQTYASQPGNVTAGQTAVAAAADLANGLNTASSAVQTVRETADADIASGVDDLNGLLEKFQSANTDVVRGTQAGKDVSDALDQRDKLLKSISNYVGIDTITRANDDMAIYTKDGTTLFETVPRAVSFTPTATYAAGTDGNQVLIDGVPLKAGAGANTSADGSLKGLLQLRDDVAPKFQGQLDEIARSLVQTFSENDPAGTGDAKAGLFTWGGTDTLQDGQLAPGIAASISVNANVDPTQGGDATLLRDGINYAANTDGPGNASVIDGYISGLGAQTSFDEKAGIATTGSVISYASDSLGWLEQYRSAASSASESKDAVASRSQDALSNVTGVSIDEEMSRLLDLEQSYKASAKMISTVNEMLTALMQAVG